MSKASAGGWGTMSRLAILAAAFFVVCGDGRSAEPAKVVDLVEEPLPDSFTRVYGSRGTGERGVPVAGGHDCDGDGFPDYAFASIQASPFNRTKAGEVSLIFESGLIGGQLDTAVVDGSYLLIAGGGLYEAAGAEIWMDDVNGDGLGDLLIGRQNASPLPGPRWGAGALSILLGSPELRALADERRILDLAAPPSEVDVIHVFGSTFYERMGIWMRTGDIDGDGIADIAVGADEYDLVGERNRGTAYVIRGGDHLSEGKSIDLARFGNTALAGHVARIHPPVGATDFHFGATVQIADLDDNGRGEVLVAATLDRAGAALRFPGAPTGTGVSIGGAARGGLYIVWDDHFPDEEWTAPYEIYLATAPGQVTDDFSAIFGGRFNNRFGEEIIGDFDLDGNGRSDLAVGDLKGFPNGLRSGLGTLFLNAADLKNQLFTLQSPPSDLEIRFIYGPRTNALGADSMVAGDFDGDGTDDLAVTNPHDDPLDRNSAGSVHVIYGRSGEWPTVIDLKEGNLPEPGLVRVALIAGGKGSSNGNDGDTLGYSAA
ncbi:MAG: hypothetical protein AAF514_14840, partial [Verrucomicrobiota bacterium]